MAKTAAKKSKNVAGVSAEDQAKLASVIATLEKQFGAGCIMQLDGPPTIRHYAYQVPSGSIGLDIAIGPMRRLANGVWQTGSMPGTITEGFGPEGCGKTTLMLTRIANYQQMGKRCAMLDMEHALDPHYAAKLGVDMTKLWWGQPANGEQCMQMVEALIKSGVFHFIGVDSVAALIPIAELEKSIGESSMGAQARLMSQSLRHIVPLLGAGVEGSVPPELFFTNQIRHKIGVMFGNPETQPGGNALKFAAHFRLDIRRVKNIVAGGGESDDTGNAQVIGHRMRIKSIKNKVSPPFRVAECSLIYGVGIDAVEELFDLCLINGIITGQGWYNVTDTVKFQGKANCVAHLREDRALCYELYDKLMVKNMAILGLTPEGHALPDFKMTGNLTAHAQFEPPTQEELDHMNGQDASAPLPTTAPAV